MTMDLTDSGVMRLTMGDILRRNALSLLMLDSLSTELKDAADNPDIRVIILAATGPAFSAGHDLKEITAARATADKGQAFFQGLMKSCSTLMQLIVTHPKPVIAEVNGVATAAGCQLVASCDLAYASETSRFATPGVNIGLFCSTPMVALSRNTARKHAMEMVLSGEMIPASRAAEIGLINRAVPEHSLSAVVNQMAETIASKPGQTLKIGKRAFYEQAEMGLAQAYTHTSKVMVENLLAADAKEGISAFLEKRDPKWES